MKLIGFKKSKDNESNITQVELDASIAYIPDTKLFWLKLNNGPTGYESVALSDRLVRGISMGAAWVAYKGVSGISDTLIIPNDQMKRVVKYTNQLNEKKSS